MAGGRPREGEGARRDALSAAVAEGGDIRHVLFERLIDDAGLFPPARKPIAEAVADHRAARADTAAWMLGRFICPGSRLADLAKEDPGADWEIGCVLAPKPDDWPATVRSELNDIGAYAGGGTVRAIELPVPSEPPGNRVREVASAVSEAAAEGGERDSEPLALFLEVPAAAEEPELIVWLEAIAEARAGAGPAGRCAPAAKLRCGGPTAGHFPDDRRAAVFISACRRLDLPFKLTAGLHHPFRTPDPGTGALQHGFVNLLAATAFASDPGGAPGPAELEPIVAERQPEAFEIDAGGLAWGDARAGPEAAAAARRLFRSFGSCSFAEPLEDLAAHHLLPASGLATTERNG
jgi:hypothetical protein